MQKIFLAELVNGSVVNHKIYISSTVQSKKAGKGAAIIMPVGAGLWWRAGYFRLCI